MGEQVIEVPSTIGIKRLGPGVVVYDSDIIHAWKRGEVSLVRLRSDGQRFQGLLLWNMIYKCFSPI